MKNIFVSISLCLLIISCQDSSVEPEIQFVQIFFKYDFNNELNTFENTYQKDLILDGTIKVKFWLTSEEQNRILNKASEIGFFSLPDTLKNDTTLVMIDPNPGEQILRIKYDVKDKIVTWIYPVDLNEPHVDDLSELSTLIISVIESKPEYKKLPPSRGGYL
jgi:hypothetical protein